MLVRFIPARLSPFPGRQVVRAGRLDVTGLLP